MDAGQTSESVRVFTVGHSNHRLEDFLSLLRTHAIASVVDIRRYPSSKRFHHFDGEWLEQALPAKGMTYHWFEDLGGWRQGLGDRSPNKGIEQEGFRNYADHMLTEPFGHAVVRLLTIARIRTTVLMCAEKDYHQCHRYYLSDYLVTRGVEVYHIMDLDRTVTHTLSPGAVVQPDKTILYPPAPQQGLLF